MSEIPDLIHELIRDHCTCTMVPLAFPFADDLEATIAIIIDGEIDREIEIFFRGYIDIRVFNWEADDLEQFTDPHAVASKGLPYRTKKGVQSPLWIKFNLHTPEGLEQLTNYLITNCKNHTVHLTYREYK